MKTRRTTAVAIAGGLAALLAACSTASDDKTSGSTASTSASSAASTTAAPSSTPASAPGSTVNAATSAPTTAAPTTTAAPAVVLPPCPVDALAKATGTVEITLWHAMNASLEPALQALADQYNGSQTKVHVTLVNQTGYDQNLDKYRTASKGDRPTLVQLSDTALKLMTDSGAIIPMQSCVNAEKYDMTDFLDRAKAFWTVDGALQAMPFNQSVPILYYNKQIFEKAGLDPNKPPTTLDEVRAYSEQIVKSGAGKFGYAFDTGPDNGGGWTIEQWLAMANQPYANNDNGRSAPATKVLFNSEQGVANLTWMQSMVKDGLAVSVGVNESGSDLLLKLADKDNPTAMAINTSAALGSVMNILSSGTFPYVTLGAGPMPGPSKDGGIVIGGAGLWLSKEKSPEETAAAWDFVKFLMQPAQQAQWSVATGYIPVRKTSLDEQVLKDAWAKTPELKVAYDSLQSGATTPMTAGAVLGPQRQIRQELTNALEAVITGADPKAALDTAAANSDKILEDYAKRTGG